jgi:hypothetical protein
MRLSALILALALSGCATVPRTLLKDGTPVDPDRANVCSAVLDYDGGGTQGDREAQYQLCAKGAIDVATAWERLRALDDTAFSEPSLEQLESEMTQTFRKIRKRALKRRAAVNDAEVASKRRARRDDSAIAAMQAELDLADREIIVTPMF